MFMASLSFLQKAHVSETLQPQWKQGKAKRKKMENGAKF